jgi:hypothetical protein
LASPDVDDPLVPEISQKYLEDYDEYCENAKFYTQRYATGPRPEYQDLIFSEDSSHGFVEVSSVSSTMSHFGSTIDAMSLSGTTSLSIEAPMEDSLQQKHIEPEANFLLISTTPNPSSRRRVSISQKEILPLRLIHYTIS